MRVLGIDPGLAIVGFGIIESTDNNSIKVVDYGVITTNKKLTFPDRLKQIYTCVCTLIEKYKPDNVAVEELFFNNNIKTAIDVSHARGVAILAAIQSINHLFEYTPLQIKQALTGYGRAEKSQVQYMVKAILNLCDIPKPDDAADALAVAICHMQTSQILSQTDIK